MDDRLPVRSSKFDFTAFVLPLFFFDLISSSPSFFYESERIFAGLLRVRSKSEKKIFFFFFGRSTSGLIVQNIKNFTYIIF